MSLVLEKVFRHVEGIDHLHDINIEFKPGSFNVLLGRTLAGKTSLMRAIAGLDKVTSGKVFIDGVDVTGLSVQKRNISMVYQQFINYPNLTVYDNIASPLKLSGTPAAEIKKRVYETANMLHIESFLKRYPLELSGGQQQRTAMARALVKDAQIILFDEPLVNLDYKLREELRQELRELFKARNSIAIYATTEANEALALGGTTSLLHCGQLLQSGTAIEQYHNPVNLHAADLYSEPPINLFRGNISESQISFENYASFPAANNFSSIAAGDYSFGIRPSHISLVPKNGSDIELSVKVDVAEISASETFLHVANNDLQMVLQLSGVHDYKTNTPVNIYLPPEKLFVFDATGKIIKAPSISGAGGYQ
ncbi:MAG: ABC transporter ATP-binding protein [Pseudomonadales bacterium]|nr:ABC transporter ATP-binding protein [Pseudomonadales bacterium]NRA16338.1 ABC transporter ATP-binding protein [Oceanospirillaceae bacterium]